MEAGFEELHDQATAKPELGSPGRIGAGLIEAAAMIEAVAAFISGMSALRKTMTQHNAQVLQQNLRPTRNLMQFVPLAQRGPLLGELWERTAQMFRGVQTRMDRTWEDPWAAI